MLPSVPTHVAAHKKWQSYIEHMTRLVSLIDPPHLLIRLVMNFKTYRNGLLHIAVFPR